jgi:predicted transcriptional regulator
LIRPAVAVPADLEAARRKIKVGLDQLDRGEGIPGEEVEAELKRVSAEFRSKHK